MKRLSVILALAVSCTAFAAPLSKDSTKGPPYFSARVGSKWVYECQSGIDNFEMVKRVTKIEKEHDALTVFVDREIDGKTERDSKIVISQKGTLISEAKGDEYKPAYWAIKTPVKSGLEWTYQLSEPLDPKDPKVTFKIVGEEDVEVPAGKFRALRIDVETVELGGGAPWKGSRWYALDVGLIKSVQGKEFAWTLKSFSAGETKPSKKD